MIRNVRKSVFETNSSSCHSVSVSNKKLRKNGLIIDRDTNKIITWFGDFDWDFRKITDSETKLSYLMTMLVETEFNKCKKAKEFYQLNGYRKIENALCEYCNCDGIRIVNPELSVEKGKNPYSETEEVCYFHNHSGYIDHQSCENYKTIDDFLNQYHLTILEFIFGDGVDLIIDNDNK